MKKIAIVQSNYIPWKGYFDMIAAVDEFIIYDDVQFTKNDWRNRNKIKTPTGIQWITIPVRQEKLGQKISQTKVSDRRWAEKHWKSLKQNYSRAEGFSTYSSAIAETYQEASELEFLSDINLLFLRTICKLIKIQTTISICTDYTLVGDRITRLVNLCEQASANVYLSGPAAKSYLEEDAFIKSGVTVEWMNYTGYREYPQLYPSFEHGVSIMDLLFNVGSQHSFYMKLSS
ncbi:MAG: WbqC family protein [Methylobacter sp.]